MPTIRYARLLVHCALALLAAWTVAVINPAHAQTLLVVGDSLSAEYGLSRGSGWVELLNQRMQKSHPQWKVVNASISGETTAGGLARLPTLLKRIQPKAVIIELGGNDALRGFDLKTTQKNLKRMIALSKQASAQVLLIGMQVPPNYGAAYAREFGAMFPKIAKDTDVAVVPFFLTGIADTPDSLKWFQADRIHPNAQAQPKMLDNVWPTLQGLL
ncbi:MAG: hypothetical protein RLZZ397_1343 [Pseudomonadota bacterium]